ncbi:MAG: F0F1 ATP synthase subunit B [Candidatus Levybacteria bacterium]|nr:F0F1 ATP synthase subunit B [Candidatus Levybacteria bacterium]
MEILNQFGFDIRLFAAQIINFLIILVVFKKFLYKPLLKTLDAREKKIARGLQDAEDAAHALAKAEEQQDKIMKKAGLEAERILTEAKDQATITRDELLSKTKEEIARLMEQTKEQIQLEKENFRKESRDVSLEIAKSILDTTIKGLFDKKDNETLIKKGLQKIKNAQ